MGYRVILPRALVGARVLFTLFLRKGSFSPRRLLFPKNLYYANLFRKLFSNKGGTSRPHYFRPRAAQAAQPRSSRRRSEESRATKSAPSFYRPPHTAPPAYNYPPPRGVAAGRGIQGEGLPLSSLRPSTFSSYTRRAPTLCVGARRVYLKKFFQLFSKNMAYTPDGAKKLWYHNNGKRKRA